MPKKTKRASAPRRPTIVRREVPHREAEPEPVRRVRKALYEDHPAHALTVVSSILAAAEGDADGARTVVDLFSETDTPASTVGLVVLEVMLDDDVLLKAIREELSRRDHVVPDWASGLDQARVTKVVVMTSLGVGAAGTYFLGMDLPDGHRMTVAVLVSGWGEDVAKDSFVDATDIESTVARAEDADGTVEMTFSDVNLTEARDVLQAAVDLSEGRPFVSDTWPADRPLVHWLLRTLPT